MRKLAFLILGFLISSIPVIAQTFEDNISVTEEVLSELNRERSLLSRNLDYRIREIDSKISNLDESIQNTNSSAEKVEKLLERVKYLEEKQEELDKNTISVYKYNYSSAVLNLASMQREIKPLTLFNSSRQFYSTLDQVSNPMNYEGYQEWFGEFKKFVEQEKEKDARLSAVSHILNLTGDLAEGTPFTGMFAGTLFDGIGSFINNMGWGDKKLKQQSTEMLKLTTTVAQFTHDKDLIETEWESINKSLDELKELQSKAMEENFIGLLDIDLKEFEQNFTNETDAKKRTQYILDISKIAENKIVEEKAKNPENWKQDYHDQMMTVQNLKIRFGTITFRILENLNKYESLIKKYEDDQYLKPKVAKLKSKLDLVRNSFESTFNPQDYIKASNEMYVVE